MPECWCAPLFQENTSRHETSDIITVGDVGTLRSSLHETPQLKIRKETSDDVLGQLSVMEYSIRWRRNTHFSKQSLETSFK